MIFVAVYHEGNLFSKPATKIRDGTQFKLARQFIGEVNYYRDIWLRQPHSLAPLNIIMLKRNSNWTKIEQDAFDGINRIVDWYNLLTYPDFNENFKIHTDASNFKLGAVIIQKVEISP